MAATAPATETARRTPAVIAIVAAVVVVLDQVTKSWALSALVDGPVRVGFIRLDLSFNPGAAFGIGKGATPFLIVLGLVLLAVLVGVARTVTGPLGATGVGLVLGGSVGNLTDRLVRDHGGAVVDFIDIGRWPVFNVADMGITVGALLLVVATWERSSP